jgi:RNA-splicing ligase RtcB
VIEKDLAAEQFDPDQVEGELLNQGIRLYRYGKDNIAGQAPASFKNPQQVLEIMAAFDLIRPVAQLCPIAVLKG